MCGRYVLLTLSDVVQTFPWLKVPPDIARDYTPRYNIAPTQPVLAVANEKEKTLRPFHWGLIPSWAKDPAIGNRMINARAETLAEKPAFRAAFRRRRCLIPASGFYEWKKTGKAKTPMHIRLKTGQPFMFAGLWETWHAPDGAELPSCTIITTSPNPLMQSIHDRMPVIVPPDEHARWLAEGESAPNDLEPLLRPYPAQEMEASPVSPRVNNPRFDSPDCLAPAADGLWE